MICPSCGKENKFTNIKCEYCGKELINASDYLEVLIPKQKKISHKNVKISGFTKVILYIMLALFYFAIAFIGIIVLIK